MFFFITNIFILEIFILMLKANSNKFTFSIIYMLYWWFFNAMGYIIYHKQYSFRILPFIWIAGCALAVIIGHYIGYRIGSTNTNFRTLKRSCGISEKKILRLIVIILWINLAFDLLSFIRKGQLSLILSPKGILTILNLNEKLRASGTALDDGTIIVKLAGVAYCFSIILYGYNYGLRRIKKSWNLKLLFFLKVLLNVVNSAGKFSIIAFIVLYVSGFVTVKIRERKLELKSIRYGKVVIYILAGGSILYFLMNNRAGKSVGLSGLLAYGFGEIPSFNYWFVEGIHESTYGVQSFYGLVSHLVRGMPFAEGYSNYPLAPVAPVVNIFTMFRALISDFGITGGLIVMLLMGISAGISYRRLHVSGFANGWMAMLLGSLFLGFLMPLGYYLTLLLAYLVFLLFMCRYFKVQNFKSQINTEV